MEMQPDPLQNLFLWSLLFVHGGEAVCRDIRPQLGAAQRPHGKITGAQRRNELRDAGLIETRTERRVLIVTLSEHGWAWANDHLSAEVSRSSTAGGLILRSALTRLQAYLVSHDGRLANLFDAKLSSADQPAQPGPTENLEQQIRRACRELTGGLPKAQVRLADLRDRLSSAPRSTLDAALIAMSRAGQLLLLRGENPRDLTPADHAAALELGGTPNHFLRME